MKPYHIQHVQLLDVFEPGALQLDLQLGNYCVFWWRHLPLGEIMLEWYDQPDAIELRLKILDAIEPAMDNYISRLAGVQGNYKDAFLKKEKEVFANMLQQVLGPFSETEVHGQLPLATVIICTRNRTADLERCLKSLYAGRAQPAEVLVVDNAPGLGNTKVVVETFGARYVAEPKSGLSVARNSGVRAASHEVLLFTDDDVVLHNRWYVNSILPFQDPQLMGLNGLVLAASMSTISQTLFEKFWRFNHGYVQRHFDRSFIDGHLKKGAPVWDLGAGANMAVRKKVFDLVGMFDEKLGAGASGCSEDSELWFRMLLHNLPLLYEPRSIVYHHHRSSLQALRSQIFNYMRGTAVAALKQQGLHPPSNYKSYLLRHLPNHYLHLVKQGFPRYRFRYATLWQEITGLLSGIFLYGRLYPKHKKGDA